MGTHLRVLNESYLTNTNMAGFRWFSKIVASLFFGRESSLSIGRVNSEYGTKPWYLEQCSSPLATTYSSGDNFSEGKIVSTVK